MRDETIEYKNFKKIKTIKSHILSHNLLIIHNLFLKNKGIIILLTHTVNLIHFLKFYK